MRYYTYRKQVPLGPGQVVGYLRGKGYYARAKPKIPTPPPPAVDRSRAQYVVFCAQEPQTALAAPAKYCIAYSADHAFRYDDLRARIAAARVQGHRVAGWCDCIPAPDGTPAAVGDQFVKDYGLDYFIGQAESAEEFDDAMSVGAGVVIGNITSLRQDQINKYLATNKVLFIQEDYWNEGWARAQHPGISAYCAGVYQTNLWWPLIQNYKDAGRWRDGDGPYYAQEELDWPNLP